MKKSLFALPLALLLTSCAGVRVTHTDIATGATNPRNIYIRPFDVSDCVFIGRHHSPGERPIRKSLAPAEFSEILREELEKIAPCMVLKHGESPARGWLVEGSLDEVNAGSPILRAIPGNLFGVGSSKVLIHVRVIDLGDRSGGVANAKEISATVADAKETSGTQGVQRPEGTVAYEFDLAGGSHDTGKFGSVTAPGLGYAVTFDYRNAAERIYDVLTPDAYRYGVRTCSVLQ